MKQQFSSGMLVPPPKGPGGFISKSFRELICGICQCVMNLNIKAIIANDGVSPTTVDAKMDYALNGVTAVLDLSAIATSPAAGLPAAGLRLQSPNLELDGTVFVPKNTVVYISPNNLLVTAGATDLVLGVNTKSQPGHWIAKKDVPAGTGNGYNVPQLPLPGASGSAPSGSPLAGDEDGDNVFWIPITVIVAPCSNLL